jgi:hypothetical protein
MLALYLQPGEERRKKFEKIMIVGFSRYYK